MKYKVFYNSKKIVEFLDLEYAEKSVNDNLDKEFKIAIIKISEEFYFMVFFEGMIPFIKY